MFQWNAVLITVCYLNQHLMPPSMAIIDTVKSGSTPVGGPDKSGRKRTKEKGRGLDKGLVRPELRPIGFNDKGVEC